MARGKAPPQAYKSYKLIVLVKNVTTRSQNRNSCQIRYIVLVQYQIR